MRGGGSKNEAANVPDQTSDLSSPAGRISAPLHRALTAGLVLMLAGCSGQASVGGWSPSGAAHYLDHRANAWLHWRTASRDHGTVCMSCHTSLPYLLARDELRRVLNEAALPAPEQRLLGMVKERVQLWSQVLPWYGKQKLASRGTESVINALTLVNADTGTGRLSPLTRTALQDMWALQVTDGPSAGSWPWINFDNAPWEAPDSGYYGTTLAAVATGLTPASYRRDPAVQSRIALMRGYLQREYPHQSLLSQVDLLWASGAMPDLIDPAARARLLSELTALQKPDGGWNLASLIPGWKRHDHSPQPPGSDGYATAFVTFALQQSGVPPTDDRVRRGLAWLKAHQSHWNGRWMTQSPNRRNGWLPHEGNHFMDDAATAFAVLSLTSAQSSPAVARADVSLR